MIRDDVRADTRSHAHNFAPSQEHGESVSLVESISPVAMLLAMLSLHWPEVRSRNHALHHRIAALALVLHVLWLDVCASERGLLRC